jgi:Leucine-rich repeat (LRR) protein
LQVWIYGTVQEVEQQAHLRAVHALVQSVPCVERLLHVVLADDCLLAAACLQLPELPAALKQLDCYSCSSLRLLPKLADTEISWLDISHCGLLTEIPDLPVTLRTLYASSLPHVARLPSRLSGNDYIVVDISITGINELPDPLPCINDFQCNWTTIQRLPSMSGCRKLTLQGCKQLQQLPEELPANLVELDLSGCTSLQQLPAQLPAALEVLNCEGCSSLQQLPDLASSGLRQLRIKGCPQLKSVCVRGCENVVVHFQ